MTITYVLIVILLLHMAIFKKLIFKWNVFGVFFIATLLFSIIGIMAFPFLKSYAAHTFWAFKLELISTNDIIKTQCIAVLSLLLILYTYVFGMIILYGKVKCIDHFRIEGRIKDNLSKTNFYFLALLIISFLIVYLFFKRDVLALGILEGLINREPYTILKSRRGITSSYLYVIITYNILPFITLVSLYLSIKYKTFLSRFFFVVLFIISFVLLLLLFQKRPLIIFLIILFLAGSVFRKNFRLKKAQIAKVQSKITTRRKYIIYGSFVFALLLLLYYSATTYQFQNTYEAVSKLSEVMLTRVFGRLSLPTFYYIHYFPAIEPHYKLTNIGLFSKLFNFDHYADTKVLFAYFSKTQKSGSLAINSTFDFYGAFGYYGLIIGNLFLGFFLCALDACLNRLEKNGINLIFIIFCFVFGYYLSQASLPRALMGYGFFFFSLTWMFLQKGFKIKLR